MRKKTGARSDAKALSTIEGAGWGLLTARVDGVGRYVAEKRIHENEDESTTRLFESSYTLEALAKQVERREREEGFKS